MPMKRWSERAPARIPRILLSSIAATIGRESRRFTLGQVFLDEPGTEMHVQLDERRVADAAEAVDLAGLDHEDVAGAGLELFAVHHPQTTTLPDELHFVVRMTMRSRTAAGKRAEQEHRHVHVAVIGADELMRASLKRQVLLANSVHRADLSNSSEPMQVHG